MRALITIALAGTLSACAATGVKVTEQQAAQLTPAYSTIDDAIARFGQPTQRTRLPDGSVILSYAHAQATVRPATFIPLVGAFVGGTDTTSGVVSLRFDSAGKFVEYTSSTSTHGTGLGASSGVTTPQNTDQPR